MILIQHRCNSVAELTATPVEYGIEIDLRNHGDQLLVTHDPFQTDAVTLDEWLEHYHHKFLIANVKEEGLEPRLQQLLTDRGITDFFILDESFPYIRKYALTGLSNFALRVSEFESVKTPLRLASYLGSQQKRVDWIWADSFTGQPLPTRDVELLRSVGFKICTVSPELHHVADSASWERRIAAYVEQLQQQGEPVCWPDMVCTKRPDLWKQYFLK